jgi:multiple sugar transport system permease protein/putative aldouronate transport system permease protein
MQNSPNLYTLQHRLYIYLNTSSNLSSIMSAGGSGAAAAAASLLNTKVLKYTISMVTVIPILLVYPFMQRYFEKGIMLGAVKG